MVKSENKAWPIQVAMMRARSNNTSLDGCKIPKSIREQAKMMFEPHLTTLVGGKLRSFYCLPEAYCYKKEQITKRDLPESEK